MIKTFFILPLFCITLSIYELLIHRCWVKVTLLLFSLVSNWLCLIVLMQSEKNVEGKWCSLLIFKFFSPFFLYFTFILHCFMFCIATNNYTCAPWELKLLHQSKRVTGTNDGKKIKTKKTTTNPQKHRASAWLVFHCFSIVSCSNCCSYQNPLSFCNFPTDMQKSLISCPS